MEITAVSWGFIMGMIAMAFVFMCVVTAIFLKSGTTQDKEKERKEWEKIIRKLFARQRKKREKDEDKRKKNIHYHG